MLGVSTMLGSSDAAAESGSSSGGGGGDVAGPGPTSAGGFCEEDKLRMDESDRSSAGNRWPRQETLALIKIRTDMDVAFRDSSLKGPLWEEVSRKLAELGYHRSAKKCKEKFENVFKYHKRTKEGRAGTKSEGKTYRFFDQLEALDNQLPSPPPRPQLHQAATPATPLSVAMPAANPNSFVPPIISNSTVSSTQHISMSLAQTQIPASVSQSATPIRGLNFTNSLPLNTFPPSSQPPTSQQPTTNPISISFSTAFPPSNPTESSNPVSVSSSSSTSSDEEPERRRKRKRKWADFFQRLTSEVMEKQEEMQRKFLQALEKRENDRAAREEEWRAQEIARMNREHDLLVQERSMAAAKDAAVITFLQKISDQQIPNPAQFLQQNNPPPRASPPQPIQQPPLPIQQPPLPIPTTPPPPQPQSLPQPLPPISTPLPPQSVIQSPPPASKPPLQLQVQPSVLSTGKPKTDNGGENLNFSPNASSSRWPKTEVEALIKLRTNLDLKYQENVPKGPLWEEISAGMLKLGYNRNPKRCKEKWENINKYFKKVKESNKKRPEDSKTCPYFQQLDALYKEKTKNESHFKAENQMAAPIMVQPEQQWPLQPQEQRPKQETEGHDSEDDEDDDDDDDDEAGNYELVASKPSSLGTAE